MQSPVFWDTVNPDGTFGCCSLEVAGLKSRCWQGLRSQMQLQPRCGWLRFVLEIWSALPAQGLPAFCSEHAHGLLRAVRRRLGVGDSPFGAFLCPHHHP